MTDLLIKPDDTGDIPTGVGESTRNLAPYAAGLGPVLRRSDGDLTREIPVYEPAGFTFLDTATGTRPAAVLGLVDSCRRIDTSDPDEFELVPTVPPQPMPVPDPQPEPKVDVLWAEIVGTGEYLEKRSVLYAPSADRKPGPRGRHRRPSRLAWLTVPLAMAWQRIGRAL